MPLANIDAADLIFGLLFPPIGTLVVYGGAYAAARAVAGGQPLSKVTKKVLKWGAVFVLGVGYDMSLTKFLEWSPQTLWTSLPVWSFLFVSLVYWQNGKTRGAPATRWRSSVRVSAWSRGERSRPACGHSVSGGSPTTMRTAKSCLRQPFTTGMAAPGFTGKPVVRAFAGEHELLAVAGV